MTAPDGERFPRSARLRRRKEFIHAEKFGKRRAGTMVVVYACRNDLGFARLGITASKKVGNAPTRNLVKRRIREIFRRNRDRMEDGFDYVVIVKRGHADRPAQFDVLRDEVVALMAKAASAIKRAEDDARNS